MDVGRKKANITYLYKFPDPFCNVSIYPYALPTFMSKLFGSINEVYPHKKSRQSDLSLEKFWVSQVDWTQLFTTVAMETTINNSWKLFCYRVKIYNYEKKIGIKELLERLALDCFNNNFSTDTGTPKKNTPYLDVVDDGEIVST